ncbi:N-acetylglucosamine-6-phosphate deacetylase [Oceanibium sediminis]|uniref:N-acetylglucosamine-6-phosphate deacetylase n=1 Tax=Oceanibium sediminis TaxID=2026339 RepID=UPI000DD3554B|nr:N-acetylglucosamine-6-phosphate deacetylase [Oceanibium sediminis]
MRWLRPHAVFDGDRLHENVAIAVEADTVVQMLPTADLPEGCTPEPMDGTLAPGLFDVQVNGGGGVMLNNDQTPEGVRRIAEAHNSVGTAFLLPTVITDHPDVTERAAEAVLAERGRNGVLGIHIEGPHINPAHKGTHDPARIRPFDQRTRGLLEKLRRRDLPVLLTVAPETLKPGTIADLARMGVTVSAGHSAASAEQTDAALAEGLAAFTHLFNGMPQMTSRAPGIIAAAINSTAYCGLIADGYHVDGRMIRLAWKARPVAGRMVLVSDAMSTIAGPESFELYGETIRVQQGKLVNASGSLAGAHIDLATSVRRLIDIAGVSVEEALGAATVTPRELMGLPRQGIVGSRLDTLHIFKG